MLSCSWNETESVQPSSLKGGEKANGSQTNTGTAQGNSTLGKRQTERRGE